MIPTPAQERVVREVRAWLADPAGRQWKYLAGYAGTGKTTLARIIAEGLRVAFCAFTGKAAAVLRSKGCAGATTLHRTIYVPRETGGGQTEFTLQPEGSLDGFDLIILDECSMANAAMATDLLSFGRRVLVLGDPFQLPPIAGEGYFTRGEPDWLLTEVHRQAAESDILRLATDVREGRGVVGPYGSDAIVCSLEEAAEREDDLLGWCDIVLVGTHRFRHYFNRRYREIAGCRGSYPEAREQLVCLQNDHRRGLLNGELWRCTRDAFGSTTDGVHVPMEQIDGPGLLVANCWTHDFTGNDAAFEGMAHRQRAKRARFAYGYALTCHKSQGSEYGNVVVVDESETFRENAARWLYTAVTRASKQLALVRR